MNKLMNYQVNKNQIKLNYETFEASIIFINPKIVRFLRKYEEFDYSFAIEDLKIKDVDFEVRETSEGLIIKTKLFSIKVMANFFINIYDHDDKIIFEDYQKEVEIKTVASSALAALEGHKASESVEHLKIVSAKKLNKDTSIYGLGDKTNYLNKRGYDFINWNSDLPQTHTENFKSLYKDFPFFIVKDQKTYGILFDNTFKTYFDFGYSDANYYFFGANDGNLNYYFIYGKDMKEVISNHSSLTGKSPLPQLWTLGNHQSRWSYYTREEAIDIVKAYRKYHIPFDCIHLDIDYMERYKVFSINNERFPDFKGMVKELEDMHAKVVTIIDPGVKVEEGYNIYEEGVKNDYFAKNEDGSIYINTVWPGESVFTNFFKKEAFAWWQDNVKFLVDNGVRGIWNDMNEPASFNGPLGDDVVFDCEIKKFYHKEVHNVYGHQMSKATYLGLLKHDKRRPFVITRACYDGTQKYSTAWSGDNQSIWPHLQLSIPQLCNLSISGMPFVGVDIGGFGTNTHKELMIRWIEASIFSPLMRNHCECGSIHQEPWCFDEETINIYRKFVNIRYEILPYLYDLFYKHQKDGLPILRPLVLEYPKDKNTFDLNDEFMVGENILVAPIIEQGKTKRLVYLPKGNWVDYFTHKTYKGNSYYIVDAPLDTLPLFIKENSIIPHYPLREHVTNSDTLILKVYGEGEYLHYQDDGESFDYLKGKYNLYKFSFKDGKFTCLVKHQGYTPYKNIEVIYKNKTYKLDDLNSIKIK